MRGSEPTSPTESAPVGKTATHKQWLILTGIASWLLYGALVWLSSAFAYGTPMDSRPIVPMLGLFAALFGLYLAGLRIAVGTPDSWGVILTFGVAIRLLVLFSEPILEVDIYRYVWDGHVLAAGVSPYRYTPTEVISASASDVALRDDLRRLAALRDADHGLATVLSRVHFAELTTPYPPASQLVFGAAALLSPQGLDVSTRLLCMKAWIVGFDVLTLVLLGRLLRLLGRSIGWSLAYGWCPLVIKEFANSGHLDSIAVCLTLLALDLAVRAIVAPVSDRIRGRVVLTAICLGAATAAKLYPIVLAPLVVLVLGRRIGWRGSLAIAAVFACASGCLLSPMLLSGHASPGSGAQSTLNETQVFTVNGSARQLHEPPVPPTRETAGSDEVAAVNSNPKGQDGLQAFLTRWRMNDFLFLIVEANLVPPVSETDDGCRPWFAFTPQTWRFAIVGPISDALEIDAAAAGFVAARILTLLVFAVLALRWAVVAMRSNDPDSLPRAAFLTIAWFLQLAPTVNPWYWTWALPLVPFVRARCWLAVSGLLMAYYLRFWFGTNWPDTADLGMHCTGEELFDYVAVWFEFGPLFACLTIDAIRRRRRVER